MLTTGIVVFKPGLAGLRKKMHNMKEEFNYRELQTFEASLGIREEGRYKSGITLDGEHYCADCCMPLTESDYIFGSEAAFCDECRPYNETGIESWN